MMGTSAVQWSRAAIAVAGAIALGLGWQAGWPFLACAGATALAFVLWRRFGRPGRKHRAAPVAQPARGPQPASGRPSRAPAAPQDMDALVEQMLAEGRYALLLRPQIARNLSEAQYRRALEALEYGMALVPDGEVVLGRGDAPPRDARHDDELSEARRGRVVRVDHFFLDRYPVTNRQFYEFVAAGGYVQAGLWDASIWPAVAGFVDATGKPGPRFWTDGVYEPGREDHPVVGVSWYEASAFARWLGKRLPTDAEWVKAASWPVAISSDTRIERRYPWGESMDLSRANLWGSGRHGTVSVEEYPGGASLGGIHQMIGNVWEWMRGDYRNEPCEPALESDSPLKSIRGGAFNTYFDNQATCQFQSGEPALGRRANIGLRCAVGVCDLLLTRKLHAESPPAETPEPCAEEVLA